jgi:hypothetical protein
MGIVTAFLARRLRAAIYDLNFSISFSISAIAAAGARSFPSRMK